MVPAALAYHTTQHKQGKGVWGMPGKTKNCMRNRANGFCEGANRVTDRGQASTRGRKQTAFCIHSSVPTAASDTAIFKRPNPIARKRLAVGV
uniref:Uncharacterized protein n=1 Tax=Arundo donax TaxID=35708 RepID=A0A0A9GUK5_ARUDO